MHRAQYDRRYLQRLDRGWPRWLALLVSPPGSENESEARAFLIEYNKALLESRIGVGILGAVITDSPAIAAEITETFGMRRPS